MHLFLSPPPPRGSNPTPLCFDSTREASNHRRKKIGLLLVHKYLPTPHPPPMAVLHKQVSQRFHVHRRLAHLIKLYPPHPRAKGVLTRPANTEVKNTPLPLLCCVNTGPTRRRTLPCLSSPWQCGVVWCGVVWCGVVWCVVVCCVVVWCGVVWCGVVWCGVVWCGEVWCGVVWCGVVWCGVVS